MRVFLNKRFPGILNLENSETSFLSSVAKPRDCVTPAIWLANWEALHLWEFLC